VDIDRYIARNEASWRRLDELAAKARTGVAKMSPAEVDELVGLYQRTSAQLSHVRTHYRDPDLVLRLTKIVGNANGVIYGKRPKRLRTVGLFFADTFPGAVYHYRRFIALAALVFFVPALVLGVWLTNDHRALDRSGSEKERKAYVHQEFAQYYSDEPAPVFFSEVTTNNIQVSFIVYALGAASGGLGALAMILLNGAPLGIVGAWMTSEGEFWPFLGYILPHGALELSAIVIAGGAGIGIGWTAIAPGDRSRGDAFREEGQRSVTIILGLMTMFVCAGLIEGFITGSGLSVGLRVGIGALLWICYIGYLVVRGRSAADRGITGLLVEPPRTWADEPDRYLPPSAALDLPGRLT
jgi:uncharacterized membrane protein SpoIIM required for sporulation